MINKRLFGTPIQGDVRRKLEARQQVAGDVQPGESIDENGEPKKYINGVFTNKDGNIEADLSSRTPFIRMWTSLKLIEPQVLADAAPTEISKEEIEDIGETAAFEKAKKITKDALGVEYSNTMVTEIRDKDGELIKIIVKDEKQRDQVDFVRKTYIVGDYNYQTSYGSVGVNESTNPDTFNVYSTDNPDTESTRQAGELLFPQQLKDNPYLKPQAGITGLSVETGDTLGVIKTTSVSFIVHNFIDFDRIYNKYFLKPGATIFVDYGWSSVDNLYKPEELLDFKGAGGIQEYLYGESGLGQFDGQVTKNQGDFDVIQGIVKDYTAKILPNGSVDCTVTLTSANSALLQFNTDDDFEFRLKSLLTRGVLFYGIGALAAASDDKETINKLLASPQSDSSTETIEEYDEYINSQALLQLANSPTPSGDSIRAGVYVDNLNVDNVYITWGLFEDFIINSQFAFGKSQSDINEATGFQVKLSSSNSMTKWSKLYVESQNTILQLAEEAPLFLLPDWWNTSDPDEDGGSYSFRQNKWPQEFYEEKYPDTDPSAYTEEDKKVEILPLREVFINVSVILDAFRNERNIKKIIETILGDLNDSSPLFNWKMRGGDTDAQVEIVDVNMIEAEVREKLLQEDDADRYFNFNIMSPNSIVKDYNLELKIPGDSIGNYYALQATSHDNNLFSVDPKVKEAINTLGFDSDSKSLIYEPDTGGYRAEQTLDKKGDSEVFNVFNTLKPLIGGEVIKSAKSYSTPTEGNNSSDANEEKESPKEYKIDLKALERITEQNEQNEIFKGRKVATSISDYYHVKLFGVDIAPKISDLMPYNLTLTTYGIGSIQPGDTFKVDYLPKVYLENSYLQIMKVAHNINSDGWFTILETQFRTRIENHLKQIDNQQSRIDGQNVVLSPKALQSLKLNGGDYHVRGGGVITYEEFKTKYLEPFMTNVSVEPYFATDDLNNAKGILIKFKTPPNIQKTISQVSEGLRDRIDRQSLYAEFLVKGNPQLDDEGKEIHEGTKIYVDAEKVAKRYNLTVGSKPGASSESFTDPAGDLGNPITDYDDIFTYVEKKDRLAHRAYPPGVALLDDKDYEMLVVDGDYAIFDVERLGDDKINKLKRFFIDTNNKVKTQATRTD